jgi:competence protein CoiA
VTDQAKTKGGEDVHVGSYTLEAWETLKRTSRLGDFMLPCCNSPAVLKTSINGVPFFSHLSDECATAPETIWHQEAKLAVITGLEALGIQAHMEMPGGGPQGKWQADVYFVNAGVIHAIEIQRSPQTLSTYLRRQQRYVGSGVRCFWLVRPQISWALVKACQREQRRRAMPTMGHDAWRLPDLPVSLYFGEAAEQPVIYGGSRRSELIDYLRAIIDGRYVYASGLWIIERSLPQAWKPGFGPQAASQ